MAPDRPPGPSSSRKRMASPGSSTRSPVSSASPGCLKASPCLRFHRGSGAIPTGCPSRPPPGGGWWRSRRDRRTRSGACRRFHPDLPRTGVSSFAVADFRSAGYNPLRMATRRKGTPKKNDATRNPGFEAVSARWQWSGATGRTEGCPQDERGVAHPFGIPPMTALRGSAFSQTEGTPQVVSAARDNGGIYAPACGFGGNHSFPCAA